MEIKDIIDEVGSLIRKEINVGEDMKENKIINKNKKTIKKMNWLKTCAEILELKKLDFKDQQYAIKTLKCVYTILLTNKARENYINELKRKVGKEYE